MQHRITAEELAKHQSRDSCWISVHDAVYDVTEYLNEHPGGVAKLLMQAGGDATAAYSQYHPPGLASQTLASCYQGEYVEQPTTPKTSLPSKQLETSSHSEPLILVNVDDFEKYAAKILCPSTAAWLSSASDSEVTRRMNRDDFDKILIRPRVLRDVSSIDISTCILGFASSLPLFICPTGMMKLAHKNGECELAVAAGQSGIIQVVSTVASMPIENIMSARTSVEQAIFFQLYVNRDIAKTKELLAQVKAAGVKAIWLTVDTPVISKRTKDERLKLMEEAEAEPGKQFYLAGQAGISRAVASSFSNSLRWEDLKWIREATSLPLVLKGIQCVEDAVRAVAYGVQGIVISNHGGRSQDTTQSSLLTLFEIRQYAPQVFESGVEVYLDGGVRRGTDILKALALGATAVGMGRPFVSALSVGGRDAVNGMLQIIRDEFETAMAHAGVNSLKELNPSILNTRMLERELMPLAKL